MAQKIDSDKLLVRDVFSKWFRIPEYQRPYVWETDQVAELLNDVMYAQTTNPEAQYFLGSLVLQKKEKEEGSTKYTEYDLLDGQQRLTTLLLITAVVRDLTPPEKESRIKTTKDSIFQMANPDDNVPERLRIVFDTREEVRNFINEYVKEIGGTLKFNELNQKVDNSDEDISIRNMSKALLTIHDYFQENKIDEFFPFLRSNVLLIYVAAEELEDAFRLFTIMNSRGVKLRNSDILKAENLRQLQDKGERLYWAKNWEEIERYFNEDFDNYLSHLRTILVKRKSTASLLKEFEDNIYHPREFDRNTKKYKDKTPLLHRGDATFKFIRRYYNHYLELFDQENLNLTRNYELYNQLMLMQKGFEADLWFAPLLRYYDKFKTNGLIEFTKKLDNKFASDWLIGLYPTYRIENVNRIIQCIDDHVTYTDVLQHASLEIKDIELTTILDGPIYGRRAAKYVMLKLDLLFLGNEAKFQIPETISIEHILPQNPPETSQWRYDFSDNERSDLTHKLGNLVLISRRKNTSQGNRDYTDKRTRYFKGNVELFSNSIRIFNQYPTWKPADLNKNHSEVLSKIKSGFGLQDLNSLRKV